MHVTATLYIIRTHSRRTSHVFRIHGPLCLILLIDHKVPWHQQVETPDRQAPVPCCGTHGGTTTCAAPCSFARFSLQLLLNDWERHHHGLEQWFRITGSGMLAAVCVHTPAGACDLAPACLLAAITYYASTSTTPLFFVNIPCRNGAPPPCAIRN